MAKFNLKDFWTNVKEQLTVKRSRERAFIFLCTFIMTYICLGCCIANFIIGINMLAYITLGCFLFYLILCVLELVLFTKYPKFKNIILSAPTMMVTAGLVASYLFLAPAKIFYIFWICVIPIGLFLTFGIKRGIIGSTVLFVTVLLLFYVPGLYNLTNFQNTEEHWIIKGFFLIYFVMCSSIGTSLAYLNGVSITKLDKLKDTYYEEANTDILTGLRNQQYYLAYIKHLNETVNIGETIGLMFIDVDDFKLYNDKYGHTVGNEVLINVAKKLNEVPHALCVRWGGDEFAILERNLTKDEFLAKANYLLKSVEALPHHVTISIGLAYYVVDENFDFQKVFNEADLQAIRAKGKGKNCIVFKE